jgi:hypothetical protein
MTARSTGAKRTTTSGRGKAAAATASRRGSARKQVEDEFVEITGGGDFPDTWDFDVSEKSPGGNDLIGTYLGTKTVEVRGDDRKVHQFDVDGTEFDAWGTAILNSRLEQIEPGTRVKVVKTGAKIKTKGGQAWEFKVFASKASMAKGSR